MIGVHRRTSRLGLVVGLEVGLNRPDAPIEPRLIDQFLVGSLLGDLARFEHENSVRGSNRRETVRDQDRGLPSVPSFDRGEDLVLGAGVDRAQGVVENEDVRSLDQTPGRSRLAVAVPPKG